MVEANVSVNRLYAYLLETELDDPPISKPDSVLIPDLDDASARRTHLPR